MHHIANLGEPSRRIKNRPIFSITLNNIAGAIGIRYSITPFIREGGVANREATCLGKSRIIVMKSIFTNSDSKIDCPMYILALFLLFCPRLVDARTEPPIPNISPIPVDIVNRGLTKLTAASALGPTPRPTIIPSTIIKIDDRNIPASVGNNNFVNRLDTFVFVKSIIIYF